MRFRQRPLGSNGGAMARTTALHRRSSGWSATLRSAETRRDEVAAELGVPGLLALAASLDLTAVVGTDYGSLGRAQPMFWWAITVWALWRTYRGGATARRVARALYALAVVGMLAVLLPGLTLGTESMTWWWFAFVFATQLWNLLAVTSGPVRDWCCFSVAEQETAQAG